LTFEFSGIRLCFSLEISHRGILDPKRKTLRYAVSNVARYEERLEDFRDEENRMRLHQKDKHFVSELIKTMRMQSKQTSSQRATELLQELIQVEKSKTKMWDSTLFHGHFQRFKRAEYVNMLRGEIQKEVRLAFWRITALPAPNCVAFIGFTTRSPFKSTIVSLFAKDASPRAKCWNWALLSPLILLYKERERRTQGKARTCVGGRCSDHSNMPLSHQNGLPSEKICTYGAEEGGGPAILGRLLQL
jgi:hypothetical protein